MDAPGEPCCTGPSETNDDHEMVVMRLVRIDDAHVHPEAAERRAAGSLLMPHMEREIEREVIAVLRQAP